MGCFGNIAGGHGFRAPRFLRGGKDSVLDPVASRCPLTQAAGAFMARDTLASQVAAFRRTVYAYYDKSGRHDLPWRHTDSPYPVVVSEIMLQQTQVDRVRVKYAEFLSRFPDWNSLAKASLSEVLQSWQGLGYNRRGRNLWLAAQMVVGEFGGMLPADPAQLVRLPGIGKATSASIAAFAFNKPVVFIETNIRSVFIHHFFSGLETVSDDAILLLVERCLDRKQPFRWYSALMDYGVYLKKTYPNPSRKSRHHTTQSTFKGSDRQVRGKILKAVLARPGITLKNLERKVIDPQGRVAALLEELIAENMIARRRGCYHAGS